jgi:hypothetical protein
MKTFKDYLKEAEEQVSEEDQELATGIETEKEHKDIWDKLVEACGDALPFTEEEFYTAIAKAHLNEVSDYYTKLKEFVEPVKEIEDKTIDEADERGIDTVKLERGDVHGELGRFVKDVLFELTPPNNDKPLTVIFKYIEGNKMNPLQSEIIYNKGV